VSKSWKKKYKVPVHSMKTYRRSNIQGAQKYSSITFQLNAQAYSPTGEETQYPKNISLGDWEGHKSGRVINIISYKMNKKSVTFSFFLSISSILNFISSCSLTFFFQFFCYQLILGFWCFMFDVHTFFLQGIMGLWWQHASMSVIVIACCDNTPMWFIVAYGGSTPLCLWLS
jgi:hypothetical protein